MLSAEAIVVATGWVLFGIANLLFWIFVIFLAHGLFWGMSNAMLAILNNISPDPKANNVKYLGSCKSKYREDGEDPFQNDCGFSSCPNSIFLVAHFLANLILWLGNRETRIVYILFAAAVVIYVLTFGLFIIALVVTAAASCVSRTSKSARATDALDPPPVLPEQQ